MKSLGVTIGKFMPLHKGHEFMLTFGSSVMDSLVVLVSGKESDEIPLSKRVFWVLDFVKSKQLNNVKVIMHTDNSPTPINVDKYGTVLDKDFQDYWVKEFAPIKATHFVSSDLYGKSMASLLGIAWLPVDPNRELINISATKIRNEPSKYYQLISKSAKEYFSTKIAIVGPESTGKSSMVSALSEQFNIPKVLEYGRILSTHKETLDLQDFRDIVKGQSVYTDFATNTTPNGLVISDTESFTTYLYAKLYLNIEDSYIKKHAIFQDFNLYVLLAPTVPWVQDGTRVDSSLDSRIKFFNEFLSFLKLYKKKFVIINSDNYESRFNEVKNIISNNAF